MAATADPRAKPPPAASHHLKSWAAPPPPPRAHRVPSLPGPAVTGGGAARDRRRSSSSSHRRVGVDADAGTVQEELPCDGRIKDLRAKLLGHLRDAADGLPLPPPPKQQPRAPEPEPAAPLPQPTPSQQQQEEATAATARPWNLRDRKCRRPTARGAAAAAALDASSPAMWEVGSEKARRSVPHQERAPFAVALTAEEVEEDVYALTGARPRRRPRKRPRVVQRQLDVRPIPHTAPRAPPPIIIHGYP